MKTRPLLPRLLGALLAVLALPLALLAEKSAKSALRETTLFAGPWKFLASPAPIAGEAPDLDDSAWASVTVPHTWSGPDGKPKCANAWYRSVFRAEKGGGRIYVKFEGAATIIDVFVNGQHLGQHRGAYTAAIFDATDALRPDGRNILAVKVSNDPDETADCLPSGNAKRIQLYRIYGGIYRKVWLVRTPNVHVFPEMASSGVFIKQKTVDTEHAEFSIRAAVRNASVKEISLTVRHTVCNMDGKEMAVVKSALTLKPGETASATAEGVVAHPVLWDLRKPNCHTVRTDLLDAEGTVLDTTTERIGFRSIVLDQEKGFLLNGKPVLFRGFNKHQETERNLTAVNDEDLIKDWSLIGEIGANVMRLPHYPHARLEYDLADEAGIAVWAENGHSCQAPHSETGDLITREMVRQNFNHPSILFWSCGNETYEDVANTAYAAVIREEAPSGLVTYGANGQKPQGLDFRADNIYPYWYSKDIYKGGDASLKSTYISENGAGGSVATHCAYGEEGRLIDKYEPEEYQQLLVERIMPTLFRDSPEKIRFFTWWTLKEFGDNKFKGRNTKGLVTFSNFRKDGFYLFKSYLRPDEPVVHICGKTHFLRIGREAVGVKVYSNAAKVTLFLNGQSLGEQVNGAYVHPTGAPRVDNVFFWDIPLKAERNVVDVGDGRGHGDKAVIFARSDNGVPFPHDPFAYAERFVSSNPASPAYGLVDTLHPQEPVYYQCDGNADNTFDEIPEQLAKCQRVATRRLSDPANATELAFTVSDNCMKPTVYVMMTAPTSSTQPGVRRDLSTGNAEFEAALAKAGFQDAGIEGLWRDNQLNLVGFRVMSRKAFGGERLTIPAATHDYVVLVGTNGAWHPCRF